MRLAAAQLDLAWEDREANYAKAQGAARRAREQGADLLVLPEMFSTGFSLNPTVTAEPPDGPTAGFLRELAREHDLALVGGLVEQAPGGRGRNVALAVDKEGGILSRYVKAHIFSFAGEEEVHEAGPGPAPFSLGALNMNAFICYDLRFPEMFRREAPHTHLFIVIASWPAPRQRHWDLLLPARALENLACCVGVNRVGTGGGHRYTGGTAAYGPTGDLMAAAGEGEGLMVVEVDPAAVEDARRRFPFLRDRRF